MICRITKNSKREIIKPQLLCGLPAIKLLLIFVLSFALNSHAFALNKVKGVRVWPAPENTRVVFDLQQKPDFSYFILTSPQRLVIDFKNTDNVAKLTAALKNDKRIKKIRSSKAKYKRSSRVVLELMGDYRISIFPLEPAGQYGHRLVIDLFDKQYQAQAKEDDHQGQRDIVIAIVAGHGGEDPGSIGASGTYEKKITLQIAQRLEKLINQQKGLKASMIRKGDYYVNLNRKTQLARKFKADLLISIHADAFSTPQPNGASVLVQSTRRADSEFSRWIQNRERNSELLGGAGETIKKTKDDNLALALGDMKKEYTMATSYEFAENVVAELKKVTKLHKKKPERLSLAVLKSADIPSVLIETGFISNPYEEKRLKNPQHQQKIAQAIFNAVDKFFVKKPPDGTFYASRPYFTSKRVEQHKVRRGESLSVIAQRYNVSVKQLKEANKLSTNVVKIGQMLKIP